MFKYSFGGDEFIYVEVSDSGMSLEAFFKAMAICSKLQALKNKGIIEICPANSSYMIRFDPDLLPYNKALELLKSLEKEVSDNCLPIQTRIIEFPVFYNDPYTRDVGVKFRDNHQCRAKDSKFDPNITDIEYAAKINGYDTIDDFISAHSTNPWFVSMIGFVAGLPWLYQLVEREKQIQVPKYLKARIDTPKLTIGHGGCFGCIYAVRGGGGYQMMGVTPIPIWDPNRKYNYFGDSMVLLRPGDIIKFTPCNEDEYNKILIEIENGIFNIKIRKTEFSLQDWSKNPSTYNKKLLEALNV